MIFFFCTSAIHSNEVHRLVGGDEVLEEDLEKVLTAPSLSTQLYMYSKIQTFYYLWRGESKKLLCTIQILGVADFGRILRYYSNC